MQTVDIVLAGFLAYGFLKGMFKGFFYEMASFVSLAIGVYAAIHFSDLVKTKMEVWFNYHHQYLNIIAFVVTFLLAVVGVLLLAKFFTTAANFASLGLFNQLLGGLFGTLKMLLFLSIILNVFLKLNKKEGLLPHKQVATSVLFLPVVNVSQQIYPFLNEWFPEVMQMKEDLKKSI